MSDDFNILHLSEKACYDYKLVLAAREGSQKAYAELHNRYRESVYFMMLKMVNNKDDSDDLTIEAFGKAFKSLHLYSPTFAFSTWLFKIATNNAIDFIRKKQVEHVSVDYSQGDKDSVKQVVIESKDLDPEKDLIYKQKIKQMKEVVNSLKPSYRQLIELRYFQEMSYEEIANELEIPIGSVKAQLFRAREFLYNILKNSQIHLDR